jgi:hypothetical protein
MLHRPWAIAAFAFIRVRFVDFVKVSAQANFASTHLDDGRADRPMCSGMKVNCCFSWYDPKLE